MLWVGNIWTELANHGLVAKSWIKQTENFLQFLFSSATSIKLFTK